MKRLVAATVTLTAIVVGIMLATSLSSSAQEDGTTNDSTTTTIAEDLGPVPGFGFGFHSDGDLPAEIDEFLTCLREQGIDVPETVDRTFLFDLHSEDFEGLAEAIEQCPLPGLGGRLGERFPFGGELPEGFSFDGELPEGFPFGDALRERFGFDGFEFHMGPMGVDRDELAACLAELGSFDSVDQVREKLDECLPAPIEFDGFEGFPGNGFPHSHGFFDFEELTPEPDNTSA